MWRERLSHSDLSELLHPHPSSCCSADKLPPRIQWKGCPCGLYAPQGRRDYSAHFDANSGEKDKFYVNTELKFNRSLSVCYLRERVRKNYQWFSPLQKINWLLYTTNLSFLYIQGAIASFLNLTLYLYVSINFLGACVMITLWFFMFHF